MEQRPSTFGAIIPERVRYDRRLTPGAKLLFAEIASFHQTGRECYASYEYFSNLYDVSEKTIQRYVHDLAECGYIDLTTDEKGRHLKRVNGAAFEPLRTAEVEQFWPGTKTSTGGGQKRPVEQDKNVLQQYSSYNTQLKERDNALVTHEPLKALSHFVNEETQHKVEELMLWLKGKKRLKFIDESDWVDCIIDLSKFGVKIDDFRTYYEWVEKLDWVTGTISPKLLRGQVEAYMRRDELADKKKTKEATNGKRNGGGRTAAERLAALQAKN
jgi:hypothetical protein